jgi:hypothetical protein
MKNKITFYYPLYARYFPVILPQPLTFYPQKILNKHLDNEKSVT